MAILISEKEIKALHLLLITSRNLAYSGWDEKKLANVLDQAEYLVSIWRRSTSFRNAFERTNEEDFEFYLAGLVEQYPEYKSALVAL